VLKRLLMASTLVFCVPALVGAQTVKEDVKAAGKDVGHGVRDAVKR